MKTNGKLLQTNVKLMQFIKLWPREGTEEREYIPYFREVLSCLPTILGGIAASADLFVQISGKYDDILDIAEILIALGPIYGSFYMVFCFIANRKKIMKLIENLRVFEEFSGVKKMLDTDKKSALFTKIFIMYGILGNLIYMAMPLTTLDQCREKRSHYKYGKDMPCELIVRFQLPFRYEHSPLLIDLANLWQLFCCLHITVITLAITMFIVSLSMQVIAQLQELQVMIRNNTPVGKCVRYHTTIIDYTRDLKEAFSSTMLIYITLTSIEMSILSFEVLMTNSLAIAVRYVLHLVGWVVLLYLICSYGQQLIDESTKIGLEVYTSLWYNRTISEQKDLQLMILRSQKPLLLSAASMGTLSYQAFLNVLSTAYSYFTLLLNLKDN